MAMGRWLASALVATTLAACGSTSGSGEEQTNGGSGGSGGSGSSTTGTPLDSLDVGEQAEQLAQALASVEELTSEEFAEAYAVDFSPQLSYDPSDALGLDAIQASALGLNDTELERLSEQGFVITDRHTFPTFVYGYETIYLEDLPVYISADSVLFALHRSYDSILEALETASLSVTLEALLTRMHENVANESLADALNAQVLKDADLFLAVARSLLTGEAVSALAGASESEIAELTGKAVNADGLEELELFGAPREMDFSQFAPRGHYQNSGLLERYFRAMMWLGRVDLRLIETRPDGSRVFHRRQFEAAVGLRLLMDESALERWTELDAAIGAFVGEHDSMTPLEVEKLLEDLDAQSLDDLGSLDDDAIADAIDAGSYGAQRISSHVMRNGLGSVTLPLNASFLLMGQRYVVDSHVFSNLVWDRVQGGRVQRMMPDPLDVAFAALGNDQAGELLAPEIERWEYAPDLASMRVLVDAHGSDYWDANLYNLWLASLRSLSPGENLDSEALPEVARTEAWGKRLLGTQLASWAELRHDTLLYAKQSYTSGALCEFPDGYVDPYPEFYGRIARYAEKGGTLVADLQFDSDYATQLGEQMASYFQRLGEISLTLQGIAEHQRTGSALDEAELGFINQAVTVEYNCDGTPLYATGWYSELFYLNKDGLEESPTIADVHTQPTDETGNPVGRVLHVGTGSPRLMVVAPETCSGPRAYVGLASSYYEQITEDFDRLDDARWLSEELNDATGPEWHRDVVVF